MQLHARLRDMEGFMEPKDKACFASQGQPKTALQGGID